MTFEGIATLVVAMLWLYAAAEPTREKYAAMPLTDCVRHLLTSDRPGLAAMAGFMAATVHAFGLM